LPRTDWGERIYAIGDIHGRYDLLRLLLDRIGEHAQELPPAKSLHLVFLGDLVDRGPDSAKVVEFLYDLEQRTDQVIVLMGNHEEAMLKSVEGDAGVLKRWLAVGGAETVASYGLRLPEPNDDGRQYTRYLQAALPAQQMRWLRNLPLTAQSGDYFFCHAGIRPGVALARQAREDLLWIRDDFIDDPADHGAVIIHGHTIESAVTMRGNRIGIDTGAYCHGVLTALYLEDERQEIISVSEDDLPEPPGRG
jgi:serine/threonine protein phosphatase 1